MPANQRLLLVTAAELDDARIETGEVEPNPLRARRGGQAFGSVGNEPEGRAGTDATNRNVGEHAPQRENALLLPIAGHEAGWRRTRYGADGLASRLVDGAQEGLLPVPFEAREADNFPQLSAPGGAFPGANPSAGRAHPSQNPGEDPVPPPLQSSIEYA
jgi:hypothetical protein